MDLKVNLEDGHGSSYSSTYFCILFSDSACDCNLAGVTNNGECTQENRQRIQAGDCFCKSRVVGRTCNQCIQGFFNLSSENPNGCQGKCT